MRVSEGELAALVRRAALGVGWPDGLAQEAGLAAACLSAAGGDGAGAVVAALGAEVAKVAPHPIATGWLFADVPVLAFGMAAFELLETVPDLTVAVKGSDPLLLGYALVASDRFQCGYVLRNRQTVLEVPWPLGANLTLPERIDITRLPVRRASARRGGVEVPETAWGALLRFARDSYVPATEQSRSFGAGAGLRETD